MVAVYLDGADLEEMAILWHSVEGFTTNPSLMRASGIGNYREFARRAIEIAIGKSISFEVLADDFSGMLDQAREITRWGPNVLVKIPVMTTKGETTGPVIEAAVKEGIKVNVTAVLTQRQIAEAGALNPAVISVFAGRIADTGRNPMDLFKTGPRSYQLLWASPREIYNVVQAEEAGCDIVTLSPAVFRRNPCVIAHSDRASHIAFDLLRGYQFTPA